MGRGSALSSLISAEGAAKLPIAGSLYVIKIIKAREVRNGNFDAGGAGSAWSRKRDIVPDTLSLILWLIAGVVGGNAAGDLLKGTYDLGPGNTVAGAIGGIVGAFILQVMIPALRGLDFVPIIGQVIGAAISGAVLTVVAGVVLGKWKNS